jgi:hypothetical protein
MEACLGNEEIRWQIVKALIDEFPALRSKVKTYVEGQASN